MIRRSSLSLMGAVIALAWPSDTGALADHL